MMQVFFLLIRMFVTAVAMFICQQSQFLSFLWQSKFVSNHHCTKASSLEQARTCSTITWHGDKSCQENQMVCKEKRCQSTAVPLYNNASNSILKEIRGYSFERGYVERLEKWSLLHDFTGAAKITILIFLKGYWSLGNIFSRCYPFRLVAVGTWRARKMQQRQLEPCIKQI